MSMTMNSLIQQALMHMWGISAEKGDCAVNVEVVVQVNDEPVTEYSNLYASYIHEYTDWADNTIGTLIINFSKRASMVSWSDDSMEVKSTLKQVPVSIIVPFNRIMRIFIPNMHNHFVGFNASVEVEKKQEPVEPQKPSLRIVK